MHPWPTIGENIARLRSLSGLAQEELAERTGVSVDLIRRLEQGNRQTSRIGSLYKIANGLDVPLPVLLSLQPVFSPPETEELPVDAGRIEGLRQLLQPVAAGLAPPATPEAATLPELRQASRDAWRWYRAGRLAEVAPLLPGFIVSGRQRARDTQGQDRDQALVESSKLYQVGAGLLTILGFADLGYAAAAQALALAQAADDPVAPLNANPYYGLGAVAARSDGRSRSAGGTDGRSERAAVWPGRTRASACLGPTVVNWLDCRNSPRTAWSSQRSAQPHATGGPSPRRQPGCRAVALPGAGPRNRTHAAGHEGGSWSRSEQLRELATFVNVQASTNSHRTSVHPPPGTRAFLDAPPKESCLRLAYWRLARQVVGEISDYLRSRWRSAARQRRSPRSAHRRPCGLRAP